MYDTNIRFSASEEINQLHNYPIYVGWSKCEQEYAMHNVSGAYLNEYLKIGCIFNIQVVVVAAMAVGAAAITSDGVSAVIPTLYISTTIEDII